MIVTKQWLNEWVDLSGVSTQKICEALNAIGLEVDSLDEVRVPKGVKVALVKSCKKHPDADKLNICQVDLGDEITQIVCGAKNVRENQFVAVATIGTVLKDDFIIKEAVLRGVESNGMICSSTEIGLPKMDDGILVLDKSIGELTLGRELSEFSLLNDDVIDIELTANRGDCLSIRGVGRDLSAVLESEMRGVKCEFDEDLRGIAQVLSLEVSKDVQSSIEHRCFELKSLDLPLLYAFRLACIGSENSDNLSAYLSYATHSTGVLLRAYDMKKLKKDDEALHLSLRKNDLGFDTIFCDDKSLSVVGISQNSEFKIEKEADTIIEASFIDPELISKKKSESKIEVDELFYKSSRGSECELSFGMNYLCSLVFSKGVTIYSGSNVHKNDILEKIVQIEHTYINSFIGQDIEKREVVRILEHLGFGVREFDDSFIVTIAPFRYDVNHSQDIIEELVRIIGIDNIKSKALNFSETRVINSFYKAYKKRTHFRQKSASLGFFETIHYFFDNKSLMQKYDVDTVKSELDITNPITNELNTLRTTLILNLINSTSRNISFGKKSVKLFEVGKVVDKNRDEKNKIAFIFSGETQSASVSNHGKPKTVDFFEFAKQISMVVGEFQLEKSESECKVLSPYESARVLIDGAKVGFMARVHIELEQEFNLPKTYICELDFDMLKYELIIASSYSKFPSLSRDLSLIIPKEIKFSTIREHLNTILPKEVVSFAPIDVYESKELEDDRSVTVKFHLQSEKQTLQDEQIVTIMENILSSLKDKFGIGMR